MAAKKRATKKRATKKAAGKKAVTKKRPAAKKAASKKRASKKKATSKKKAAAPAKKSGKVKVGAKPPTKTEILNHIADETELSRKEVAAVFESMTGLMTANLSSDHGSFRMPGLFKVTAKYVAPRKAYRGLNRLTGLEQMFKAKPASSRIRMVALKAMKDQVKVKKSTAKKKK